MAMAVENDTCNMILLLNPSASASATANSLSLQQYKIHPRAFGDKTRLH